MTKRPWVAFGAVLAVAFVVRLLVGLPLQLEGDEATVGLAAWHVAHGQLLLMEPSAHYQGSMSFYILAPFELVFGHTQLALRVGMSAIGTGYVAAMYLLGRWALPSRRDALLLAGVAALFPYYALAYGDRGRTGYGDSLVLQALLFAFVARIGWRTPRKVDWALLGFVAGVGLWGILQFLAPCAIALFALLLRESAIDWRNFREGFPLAVGGAVVGFSPWLVFNLTHGLLTLHSIPKRGIGIPDGIPRFYDTALPAFMGTAGVLVPLVTLVLTASLVPMALAGRARLWHAVGGGRLGWLQPLDYMFALLLALLALVTVTQYNGVYYDPRYFLPAAVPLAVMAALSLRAGRWLGPMAAAVVLVFVVAGGITTSRLYPANQLLITNKAYAPVHWQEDVSWLEAQHPEAVFADYWLERPLQYLDGGAIPMAPYNGYLSFPDDAALADSVAHPDYLFLANDPDRPLFERVCAAKGVVYTKVVNGDRVLYHHLSSRLLPADFGWRAI